VKDESRGTQKLCEVSGKKMTERRHKCQYITVNDNKVFIFLVLIQGCPCGMLKFVTLKVTQLQLTAAKYLTVDI